jgi:hypothetical protein
MHSSFDTSSMKPISSGDTGGHRAYAMQKASAYGHMAKQARDRFAAAGGTWPENERNTKGMYFLPSTCLADILSDILYSILNQTFNYVESIQCREHTM